MAMVSHSREEKRAMLISISAKEVPLERLEEMLWDPEGRLHGVVLNQWPTSARAEEAVSYAGCQRLARRDICRTC